MTDSSFRLLRLTNHHFLSAANPGHGFHVGVGFHMFLPFIVFSRKFVGSGLRKSPDDWRNPECGPALEPVRVGMRGAFCLLYLRILNFSIIREARHTLSPASLGLSISLCHCCEEGKKRQNASCDVLENCGCNLSDGVRVARTR
jgi:hypothetical protein